MIVHVTLEELKETDSKVAFSFFNECKLPGTFKIEAFLHNWSVILEKNAGVMWKLIENGKMVGAMGGILFPDLNSGDLVATEAFWYVLPEYRGTSGGLKLLVYFERWAKEVGAKRCIMTHLVANLPNAIPAYYARKGYQPVEINYVKELV